MKIDFIINVAFLVCFVFLVIFTDTFVESWWSFIIGILFTLTVRDVWHELSQRLERRQARRVR